MKTKSAFLTFFILIGILSVNQGVAQIQDNQFLPQLSAFAAETQQWNEGYSRSTGQNDFTYSGLRPGLTDCMLTRCSTGDMAIEWETQPVGAYVKGGAGFVWLAAIDITKAKHVFDVFINQVKRFQITSANGMSWEITNPDGGRLRFVPVKNDPYWEAHGYMSLWAPEQWLTPGKPISIKIVGEKENNNSWIIVYKAKDAQSYLQNSFKCETRATVTILKKENSYRFGIVVPAKYIGQELVLTTGKKSYKLKVEASGDQGKAVLSINKNMDNQSVLIADDFGEMVYLSSVSSPKSESILIKDAILRSEIATLADGSIEVKATRDFIPQGYSSLSMLAGSKLAGGKILLMNSSHQDIAWMDSPEKCVIERDTMLLTPLYNRAINDASYRFDIEDALMLKEFIQRHPDKKEGIIRLLKNGQLSCGSTFIQPYEEMYSGEALARQLYFGTLWLKKEFGYSANTYWNPDVPGKTLQMPQILSKAGTKYMLISRFEKGVYNWYSPDGSFVTTYSPGHYSADFQALHKDFPYASDYIAGSLTTWDKYYEANSSGKVVPLFSDWDMSPANDYSKIINTWNHLRKIESGSQAVTDLALPKIELSLTPDFIKTFSARAGNIPSVKGERPAVWLYIHGPTHEKTIKTSREGDILLTVAEKFATINAMIDGSFSGYPGQQLSAAWESKIYPDHGWGGKHGDITDAMFAEKYQFAKSEAEKVIKKSITAISSKIKTVAEHGIPVTVFNSLSWKRSDPASATLVFDPAKVRGITLTDAGGKEVPVQLANTQYYADGSIKSAVLQFIATDVPSIGYKTYYVKTSGKEQLKPTSTSGNSYENRYYKIELADGGLSAIFDKELNKNLINNKKFNAGEVFTLHSEGTGAGEFADIQQPDMEGYDKAGNYRANWKMVESGPVYTSFINRQPIRNAVIEEKIILYHDLKKIDFEIALLNYEGILYREYRMALPVNMNDGQVSYEVPYGVVNVGKDEIRGAAGERHQTNCADIHPRGIENWIGISNSEFGVTLSSGVAVADYIDPTGQPEGSPILQPLLLASRRSCHGEGNEYLQTGDHHFSFSLTSHKPGWENGFRFGRQANEKLQVVVDAIPYQSASLPEEMSFFNLQNDNLVISAIKKAEDDNGVAIRMYDLFGKATELNLKCFKPLKELSKANLIEEKTSTVPVKNGVISTQIGAYSIETIIVN